MEGATTKSRREKFEALRAAGQTVRQAAAAVGVAASTGYAWSKGPRQGEDKHAGEGKDKGNGFARLIQQHELRSPIELEVAGVIIRVPREFDPDALTQLICEVRRST